MSEAQNQSGTVAEAANILLKMGEPEEAKPEEQTESQPEAVETSEETPTEEEEVLESTPEEETVDESADFSELNEWLSDPDSREQFENLKIKTKVNGVEGEATLADLVKSFQIGENVEQLADGLKSRRREFEEEKTQALNTLNTQLTQAASLVDQLEKSFLSDFEKVNWEELRTTDPAEFSARRQEMLERQQGIQNTKASIVQTQQGNIREQLNVKMAEEAKRLPEIIPAWTDNETAAKEKAQIRDYLFKQGFSQGEIDGATDQSGNIISTGIVDARAIALARKAMLFDQGQSQVEVTKKKVRKVPKIAKPGKPQGKQDVKTQALKDKRKRLKKSGRLDDAASLIHDTMFGGQ